MNKVLRLFDRAMKNFSSSQMIWLRYHGEIVYTYRNEVQILVRAKETTYIKNKIRMYQVYLESESLFYKYVYLRPYGNPYGR